MSVGFEAFYHHELSFQCLALDFTLQTYDKFGQTSDFLVHFFPLHGVFCACAGTHVFCQINLFLLVCLQLTSQGDDGAFEFSHEFALLNSLSTA
jgi:hypothetical protein